MLVNCNWVGRPGFVAGETFTIDVKAGSFRDIQDTSTPWIWMLRCSVSRQWKRFGRT